MTTDVIIAILKQAIEHGLNPNGVDKDVVFKAALKRLEAYERTK